MTAYTRAARLAQSLFVAVLAAALLLAAGCSKPKPKAPESLMDKIPTKEAVIRVDGHEVAGSWLRNWCITQYLTVMKAAKGTPLSVDEYSLILSGQDLLGRVFVVALEAEKRGLTVSDQEVQDRINKEAARFESTAEWQKRMEKSGVTVDERKKQIRIEMLADRFREQIIVPEVAARFGTDKVAKEYYDKFPDLFKVPRRLHLLHITRSVAKDATLEIKHKEREAIDKARARVAGGEGFDAVAREVSTEATAMKGGDVGWVTEETGIQPQIKAVVLGLKPGELSPVLESPQGFHLFKAVEVKEAGKRSFDEAKDEIKKRLVDQAAKNEMEKTAAQLRAKLVAEKKYQILDLKQLLGPPPAPKPGAPGAPGAPVAPAGGTGAAAPAAH